jgi:hypothetical protein
MRQFATDAVPLVDGGPSCAVDVCCPPPCRATPSIWAQADYLLWWTKGVNAPPLATTSPTYASPTTAGVLGQPNTTVLFGGERINDDSQSGGRFTLGTWLDAGRCTGVEAMYLFLDEDDDSFRASSNDLAIVARPFFNSNPGVNAQDALRISFPGTSSGTLSIGALTRFQTFEGLMRRVEWQSDTLRIDGLLGYRFAELQDRVRFDSTSLILAGAAAGSTIVQFDDFQSRNTFHGGVLGVAINWQPSMRWSTDLVGKVGLGGTRARTHINGQSTSTTAGGMTSTSTGGLLAQGTNIGVYTQDDFSVFSELSATLRRTFPSGLSTTFGYTFLYWTDVARAGEQIDLNVNTSQIPPGMLVGPARPAFPFNTSGFWAQGMRFGLEYNY